jgi:hypothetical protein
LGDPVDRVSCPDMDIHFPRTWESLWTGFHVLTWKTVGK